MIKSSIKEKIIHDIDQLSPENFQELADFIEFLRLKQAKSETKEREDYLLFQQENLKVLWNHPDEDIYDL